MVLCSNSDKHFFSLKIKFLFSFETSKMIGITDITFLHCLITVSHFLKAVEKSSSKTTAISLETGETEKINVQSRSYDCNLLHGCIPSSEKPTVTISSKLHTSLLEGERLTLICLANRDSKEIRWTKDDVPLNRRASVQKIGSNSILVIEKVLIGDSGKYSCKAVNKAGSASSSLDIRVTSNKDTELI